MDICTTNTAEIASQVYPLPVHDLMNRCEQLIQDYWEEYPDLYRIVQLEKQKAVAANEALLLHCRK